MDAANQLNSQLGSFLGDIRIIDGKLDVAEDRYC